MNAKQNIVAVNRRDLEALPPGLYVLRDESGDVGEVEDYNPACNQMDAVLLTGRILARVCNHSMVPSGVRETWHRGDGKTVVTIAEHQPAINSEDRLMAKRFLGIR